MSTPLPPPRWKTWLIEKWFTFCDQWFNRTMFWLFFIWIAVVVAVLTWVWFYWQ